MEKDHNVEFKKIMRSINSWNVNNNNGTNYTNNSSTQSQAPDPFAGSGDTIDITDDDLPF